MNNPIWSLSVPNKIRNFGWRACNNILPSLTSLCKKGVISNYSSYFCRENKSECGWEGFLSTPDGGGSGYTRCWWGGLGGFFSEKFNEGEDGLWKITRATWRAIFFMLGNGFSLSLSQVHQCIITSAASSHDTFYIEVGWVLEDKRHILRYIWDVFLSLV